MPATRSKGLLANNPTTDTTNTGLCKTRKKTRKGAEANATTTAIEGISKLKTRQKTGKGKVAKGTPPTHLPSSVADSPLFRLPSELRNMIYRFALTTDGGVVVTESGGIPESALLSVSKVLRSETYGVFYNENEFVCEIKKFSPATLLLAARKGVPTGVHPGIRNPTMRMYFHERCWKNLVSWLHMSLEGKCGAWGVPEGHEQEERFIRCLFTVALGSPSDNHVALDLVLESMRPALVDLHADWGQD